MAGIGAVSLNMVWNPAIKGSNFLQASVKGIHTYAQKVTKANLLQSTKFSLLNRNLKQLDNHLGHIRKTTAKISANPIKLDIKTSRTSLKEARKDMTAIEHDAKQVAFWTKKSSENLKAGANAQRKTMQKKAKSSQVSGSTIVGAVAVASVLTLPFKASIEFESKMARVKALSGATDKEFKALNNTALKLGATTEWSAGQVAEGMQFLSMAGFNANQTISAMPGLLALATAGATDLATTSDIASNIMGGFNIDPTDTINGMSAMSYVSDVLAKTITSANVDMRMLGDTMKYVAPVAKTAGMSLQETSAMAGLLGNIGIQGSMAGTTLKSMVLRLASPTGKARKALSELGVSALDAQGNIRSMPLLLKEVAKATENMGSGDRLGFIKRVFGTEPAAGINKLIEQSGSGALDKYLSVVNQYKGSAKKIADIQLQSTAGHFKLLGSAMEGLSISATTGLLPAIKFVTKGLTSVASKVQGFTKSFPEASKWIFGLGAAFVIGSVALAGFGLVASGVGAGLALLASPVTAIVLGVVAIGAGLVYLYNKFDFVSSAVDGFFSGLLDGISPAVNALKSSFGGLFGAIGGLFNSLKPVFSFFSSALNMIGINFNNTGGLIGSAFGLILFPIRMVVKALTFVINIGAMVVDGWVKIGQLAGVVWSGIASFISSIGIGIKNTFIAMFNWSPIGLIVNNWGKIGAYFLNIASIIKKPFVSFFDWIGSKFKAVFGLIDKAKSVVNAPIETIKSGASKLWSGTKSIFGFGDDKKEPIKSKIPKAGVPVNNVDFKPSSLKEAQIAQVPLESVSDVTAGAINETKSFMQNNTNNTQGVNQNITNHITVNAPAGGQVDYEDLKIKLVQAQKELSQEDTDLQMQDAS